MKKLYTLLSAIVLTGMVQAQDWNISHADFNALGSFEETKTINGLTLYAAAGKALAVDANEKTVDEVLYTHRLKLGGSGTFTDASTPASRVLAFSVTGNTKITIVCQSSSGSEDRVLNVAAGTNETILQAVTAPGAAPSKTVLTYTGGATTIFLWSPASGVNVYHILAEEDTGTAIRKPMVTAKVTGVEYFNITGVRMGNSWNELPTGLYMVKRSYDNGMSETQKVLKTIR